VSAATKPCRQDEDFLAYFTNEMDETARDAFLDHVFSCRTCRLKFDATRALEKELGPCLADIPETPLEAKAAADLRALALRRLREAAATRRRHSLRIRRRVLAWALPALAAVLVGGYFLVLRAPLPPVTRAAEGTGLRLIAPVGRLTEPPRLFTWTPLADADNYYFRLIDDELNLLASEDTKETVYRLDEAARRSLARGRTYLWTIEVRAENGAPISSAKATFIVR